ncbi:MAG: bifunctional adenosylcobinamide kinase/adenosylcobinamide-phosphate guanylyltransferase [Eubacterium sp.]|nr:bifunctional adenosylcobinamide kinase/adenosylcobinamide-phosphate guanylyltransferase [Eubacterium sp.]SEG05086.1 adenosylcobinamide kinase /adenosylcobinamide-phosphate guanylyltransferase [Eubacterium ruminantium]
MDLFIGGHSQGKLELVKERYGDKAVILNELHLFIRKELEKISEDDKNQNKYFDDGEIADIICKGLEKYLSDNGIDVVISDEIGCGIVPMEHFDRLWRDVTGKVLIRIAESAENVYRVTCGIAQKIK